MDTNDDNMGYAVPGNKLVILFSELSKTGTEYTQHCVQDNLDEVVKKFLSLDFSNNKYNFYTLDESEYSTDMDKDETYYFFQEEDLVDFLNDFVSEQINHDLMQLNKMGLVEYKWDDVKNDFVFGLTEAGRGKFDSSGE